jgi:hypothetical protein
MQLTAGRRRTDDPFAGPWHLYDDRLVIDGLSRLRRCG